ncbi:hypothetical protein TRFO_22125 [Tritrichomonas foetus]|uniref:Uncharacterized protein n=1 Tax=Tritrichomonas foetus TaxID=1144522 RepID=A0A1J4KDY5_9EUKA|nr:hypothetical protein TRFO_22125 [Tritrichomonas foetus]|eukprot:OHT09120.1 hypothetical protein TRFO_22125 [Tritrichomonas foetus]
MEETKKLFMKIDKRQTQSLSPSAFNSVVTQRRGLLNNINQKTMKTILLEKSPVQQQNTSFKYSIINLNKTRLAKIFTSHPVLFKRAQEMILFIRPIPMAIFLVLFNLLLYFYRSFQFPFYSLVAISYFLYYSCKIISPRIWPILEETLFEPEIKVDPNESNHLRSPDDAADFIYAYYNPIRLCLKAFTKLSSDTSITGLQVMLCVYAFLFFLTFAFDLFWPFAIAANVALIGPGIYFCPIVRVAVTNFKKRWNL